MFTVIVAGCSVQCITEQTLHIKEEVFRKRTEVEHHW